MTDEKPITLAEKIVNEQSPETKKDLRLFYLLILLGIVLIRIHVLFIRDDSRFDSTAALYIGIPFLLALALALAPKSKTSMGTMIKVITLLLLMSAPLLGEGFICILMAAPIFYLVAIIVFYIIRAINERNKVRSSGLLALIMIASLEGVTPYTTFDRNHEATVSQIINAPIELVERQLQQTPSYNTKSPWLISIFPHPKNVELSGTELGDTLKLDFEYKKHIWWNAHHGQAEFQISQRKSNKIEYSLLEDTSYLSTYLTWKTSAVTWKKIDQQHTEVTWTVNYQRNLDPSWYYGPLEYFAVKQMAKSLINNVATPRT